jgi:hypothetical protein
MKIVIEDTLRFKTNDGGHAKIAHAEDPRVRRVFFRVQSWIDRLREGHPEADELEGKRVRITLEVLD